MVIIYLVINTYPLNSFTMPAASAVSFSIASKSPALIISPLTIQLPPQQNIFELWRYSFTLFALMPPVGMNFTLGNAAPTAEIILRPPAGSAGKNFRVGVCGRAAGSTAGVCGRAAGSTTGACGAADTGNTADRNRRTDSVDRQRV